MTPSSKSVQAGEELPHGGGRGAAARSKPTRVAPAVLLSWVLGLRPSTPPTSRITALKTTPTSPRTKLGSRLCSPHRKAAHADLPTAADPLAVRRRTQEPSSNTVQAAGCDGHCSRFACTTAVQRARSPTRACRRGQASRAKPGSPPALASDERFAPADPRTVKQLGIRRSSICSRGRGVRAWR
jgi:hypothetical protein